MGEITIEEKKKIILDIMSDVDAFCRENNIRYVISSGTLLGAVRHGGFIPWDDDADMFMLREDFDKFIASYKGRKYHALYNTNNENEFLKVGYAKISDPSTSVLSRKTQIKFGVYVDLFPLDSVPEDIEERNSHMDKVMKYHRKLHHRQNKDFISILISYYHSLDWWWKKCDATVRDPKYKNSPLVAHILGARNQRTVFNKKWFENLEDIEFEGRKFRSFKDTHSYLKMVYGDYMTPPPLKDRRGHCGEKFFKL